MVVSDILSEVGDALDEDSDDENGRDPKSYINALDEDNEETFLT